MLLSAILSIILGFFHTQPETNSQLEYLIPRGLPCAVEKLIPVGSLNAGALDDAPWRLTLSMTLLLDVF